MSESLELESLKLIIDSLPTGTIIVNSGGKIVMLNRQVEEWFGFRKDEMLGQLVELLIPERFVGNHPRYRSEYFSNPNVRPMGTNRDLYARRSNGSEFLCDISLHPLSLSNGIHVLVHIVDATDRRQSEFLQRHEESLRRMKFMVENLPTGAIYVSLEAKTLIVNRAFVETTGYSNDELVDLNNAFSLLFREKAYEVQQHFDGDQDTRITGSKVLQYYRKDGTRGWVEIAVYRYNNHEVWLWHDITERRAAQERLVQSERLAAIGQMVTGLAHESRNALQRARAALEMLDLDLGERPHLRTLSGRAVAAIEELQRLYEEVRDYAAPIQLDLRETDLEALWQETWQQVQLVCRDKHISMITRCDEQARTARIDRHRFKQVFRNIFENAAAVLSATDGKIEVTSKVVTQSGTPWITISIQDNGIGMTAEQQARIFEPFYTTKTRGTGLGMAIVRRIMDAHGGTASVGAPESGALIILRLPKKLG